ncbi:hypothetical protein chiPu_0010112 [Chiloscyllium punctatum]|uniref:Uncharacterized protein n=1 Tax=Chiloscyllium punctatum TaxID=137246 RepID=A0A401SMM7_CHIPU|nr:hypothetical protein [Chiloscyllium punctatum]
MLKTGWSTKPRTACYGRQLDRARVNHARPHDPSPYWTKGASIDAPPFRNALGDFINRCIPEPLSVA